MKRLNKSWYGECFEQKDFSKIFFSIIDFFTGRNTSDIYETMKNIDFLEEAKNENKLRTLVKEYFENNHPFGDRSFGVNYALAFVLYFLCRIHLH